MKEESADLSKILDTKLLAAINKVRRGAELAAKVIVHIKSLAAFSESSQGLQFIDDYTTKAGDHAVKTVRTFLELRSMLEAEAVRRGMSIPKWEPKDNKIRVVLGV